MLAIFLSGAILKFESAVPRLWPTQIGCARTVPEECRGSGAASAVSGLFINRQNSCPATENPRVGGSIPLPGHQTAFFLHAYLSAGSTGSLRYSSQRKRQIATNEQAALRPVSTKLGNTAASKGRPRQVAPSSPSTAQRVGR